MTLNDIYTLTNAINQQIIEGNLTKDDLLDLTISIKLDNNILFGVDKEFYRLSHDGSIDGFKHSPKVNAKLDGINFILEGKVSNS